MFRRIRKDNSHRFGVLISLIINEYRSILENLVEAGFDVPQILVKGLEVASQNIESMVENNE